MFLFLNRADEVYHVYGNIGQSGFGRVVEQVNCLQIKIDNGLGEDSGFILIIDNAQYDHKALRKMTNAWKYYPPANPTQTSSFYDSVQIEPLNSSSSNSSKCRAQFYRLCSPTDGNADNARFV